MSIIRKKAFVCAAAVAAALLLVGAAAAVGRARSEKIRYIQAEREMARRDLCDAADEMLRALKENDAVALCRAAGRAEAYLSRAGYGDCGAAYLEIKRICSGEYGEAECQRFAEAVKEAAEDDGGALREIGGGEFDRQKEEEETTEDLLASRMLERLGKGRDDVAYRRAKAFACPNAEFREIGTDSPSSFAYSGENVFVLVSGETPRILMYCFDREIDPRFSVTEEQAERNVEMIIKKEKLRLGEKQITESADGVYRILCYGKGELDNVPLVTLEIYSDTGRLRLYDATSYYESLK